MFRRSAVIAVAVCLAGAAGVYVVYLRNVAPITPSISAAEASNPTRPFVVQVHAQWCPVCGRTREVTASIAGSRNVADYRAAIDAALARAQAS